MSKISDKWTEITALVEAAEVDVHKNAGGNASAGVRARKKLRQLKQLAADLVKLTIEEDKARKEA